MNVPNLDGARKDLIAQARNMRLEDVAARYVTLEPKSGELVGLCPKCGDSGHDESKGDVDRFAINPYKQVWNCRQCQRNGDPKAGGSGSVNLMMWINDIDFKTAVTEMTNKEWPKYEPKVERLMRTSRGTRACPQDTWKRAKPAKADHPYLVKKGVQPHGLRAWGKDLALPVYRAPNEIMTLQYIHPDGSKDFMYGWPSKGGYYWIGKIERNRDELTLVVCEGFATGASIHAATGYCVYLALSDSNLETVAIMLRGRHPDAKIIIAADDDNEKGISYASGAARAADGLLAVPVFGEDRRKGEKDFNDVHQAYSLEIVKEQIEDAQEVADADDIPISSDPEWPQLHSDAMIGLAGDVVRAIEPTTEADPVALLALYLAAFGSAVGRKPYYQIEATRHYAILYLVLVGASGSSRKGTAQDRIDDIIGEADQTWKSRRKGGIGSGEGLIDAVHDPIINRKGEEVAPAVEDKRLHDVESEFGSLLSVMKRPGNTASMVVRNAWDGKTLEIIVKGTPNKATDAHITIVGHVTPDEYRRELDRVSMANGFANRFLHFCTKRSKLLPEGGSLHVSTREDLIKRTTIALRSARGVERVVMDRFAMVYWRKIYTQLSEELPGLLGAITARGPAQCIRIAMIYALLDKRKEIHTTDLQAAFAVWNYCLDSARCIFGDILGDPMADAILEALKQAGAGGLTRTQIRDMFSHNSRGGISPSLTLLAVRKLAHCQLEETDGRSAERWFAG